MSIKIYKEIKKLNKQLIKFSLLVEQQVGHAIQSTSDLDLVLAKRVIKTDKSINKAEIELEENCLKILALHQPVAEDLRLIVSVLKINNDLERIGDHAVYIAEKAIDLTQDNYHAIPNKLFELSAEAKLMLRKSLLAFVEQDKQVANAVLSMKPNIKQLSHDIFHTEVGEMKEDSEHLVAQLNVLDISRQLKRIADHAINIAEDTLFLMDGDIVRHKG